VSGRRLVFILLSSVLAILTGCSAGVPSRAATVQPGKDLSTLFTQEGREADDTARFLAGMRGKPGSPYLELEKDPVWLRHQESLDELWSKFELLRHTGLKEFGEKELAGKQIEESVLFYPFGGPDALTPLTLFPRNSRYVLAALEPPGTVPEFPTDDRDWMSIHLPSIASTLSHSSRAVFSSPGRWIASCAGR
jgi:hypothetical protein